MLGRLLRTQQKEMQQRSSPEGTYGKVHQQHDFSFNSERLKELLVSIKLTVERKNSRFVNEKNVWIFELKWSYYVVVQQSSIC